VARPGELFSCLTDGRRFLRALAPVLVIIALGLGWIFILEKAYGPYMENMMNFTQSSTDETGKVVIEFSPFVYAIPLAWLCLAFGSMIVTQLYYAIFLWPEVPIGEVLWRGGKRAAGAIGRLICMNVAICWKPFLIFLGVMIVGVLLGMFMGMVAFLIILILLMIGMLYYVFVYLTPYMMLAFGGLEIDVFSEKPEEAE